MGIQKDFLSDSIQSFLCLSVFCWLRCVIQEYLLFLLYTWRVYGRDWCDSPILSVTSASKHSFASISLLDDDQDGQLYQRPICNFMLTEKRGKCIKSRETCLKQRRYLLFDFVDFLYLFPFTFNMISLSLSLSLSSGTSWFSCSVHTNDAINW